MKEVTTFSHPVRIYIAGPVERAKELIAEFCMEHGACFTVTPTEYVYTGGRERGMIVGLINYPRFPADADAIEHKAVELARVLIEGLHQWSASVECPQETIWLTRRPEDLATS